MIKHISWFVALTISLPAMALDLGSSSKRVLGPDQPVQLPDYQEQNESEKSPFKLPDVPKATGPLKQSGASGGAKFILKGLQFSGLAIAYLVRSNSYYWCSPGSIKRLVWLIWKKFVYY